MYNVLKWFVIEYLVVEEYLNYKKRFCLYIEEYPQDFYAESLMPSDLITDHEDNDKAVMAA